MGLRSKTEGHEFKNSPGGKAINRYHGWDESVAVIEM